MDQYREENNSRAYERSHIRGAESFHLNVLEQHNPEAYKAVVTGLKRPLPCLIADKLESCYSNGEINPLGWVTPGDVARLTKNLDFGLDCIALCARDPILSVRFAFKCLDMVTAEEVGNDEVLRAMLMIGLHVAGNGVGRLRKYVSGLWKLAEALDKVPESLSDTTSYRGKKSLLVTEGVISCYKAFLEALRHQALDMPYGSDKLKQIEQTASKYAVCAVYKVRDLLRIDDGEARIEEYFYLMPSDYHIISCMMKVYEPRRYHKY